AATVREGGGTPWPAPRSREAEEVERLRQAAKLRVVARVVSGELDLPGAVDHFRQINHEPPGSPELRYRLLPGVTDEEKLCREVIMWVKFRYPRGGHEAGPARISGKNRQTCASDLSCLYRGYRRAHA
ncbi:MAG: hypothetical protein WAU75_09275, partial [Solirubrobacteraceae bacterium]